MQETITLPPVKQNFNFVDTIRCISMFGIVFEHSSIINEYVYENFFTSLFQASVIQFFKFSSIAFFLIAGFLINHKLTEYTPLQYLKNRFKNTIGPWLFWLNVFVLAEIANLVVKYYKYDQERPLAAEGFLPHVWHEYYETVSQTSFWFILNFLICIAILLLFKRYIYKLGFGIILGCATLFYSINIYHGWIQTSHTTALFGFVFFLWLGVYMNLHFAAIERFIKKTPCIWLILVNVVLFFLADLEAIYIQHLGIGDAYNTLRITNILYSLTAFALLLKIGPIDLINRFFEPRKTTYGIYLIHMIVMARLLPEICRPLRIHEEALTLMGLTAYTIFRFVVIYTITMICVKLILKTKFRWSIGS